MTNDINNINTDNYNIYKNGDIQNDSKFISNNCIYNIDENKSTIISGY